MAICGLDGRPLSGDGDGEVLLELLAGAVAPTVACWDNEDEIRKGDGVLDETVCVVDTGVVG